MLKIKTLCAMAVVIGMGCVATRTGFAQAPLPTFVAGQTLTDAQLNAIVARLNSNTSALATLQTELQTARDEIAALDTRLTATEGATATNASSTNVRDTIT